MSSGTNLSALMREAAASGSEGNAGGGDEGKSLESQNETLRQRVAKAERDAQASAPYVNLVLRLRDSGEVGQKIIQKLIDGKPLTDFEEKKVVDAEAKAGTPLTEERVQEILSENNKKVTEDVAVRMRDQQSANEKNQELNKWASEKLKGYDNLKSTQQWGNTMDVILGLYHNKQMYIPDGKDHWEAIYERAYATCIAEDPEIAKGKQPAAPSAEERARDILSGGSKKQSSKAATEEGDDPFKDHPELKRELDFARNIGSGTIGKSFGRKAKMK